MFVSQTKSINRHSPIISIHRFLLHHSFYPLMLCSLLGLAFLATRAHIVHHFQFRFLVWNLFLAWIPYGLSLIASGLARSRRHMRIFTALVWLAWLAMFPNAPYILTDMVHLFDMPPRIWWFDLGTICTFALAGCFLGVVSLRIMHDLIRPKIGAVGGWVFVIFVAALSGFGIDLGRFSRLNSWDLLTRPQVALAHIGQSLADLLTHSRTLGVTLMFGAMVLVTYVMFTSTAPAAPQNAG